jgi:heparan-alpha-glucosaminide N-acetyltransferase
MQNETSTTMATSASLPPVAPQRMESIDIYRGMVMFLMLAEVLHLNQLSSHKEGLPSWVQRLFDWITFHTSHVEWAGCSLHDMIQPSFSFLVGTSLAFSYLKRSSSGQSWRRMLLHAVWRSFVLISLGIFLRSLGRSQTNFTFDDTLTQIGLGYLFLFLCAPLSPQWLFVVCSAILIGYWGAFVAYPLPGEDFPYEQVGVPMAWPEHYTGFASHWNKNSNLAWQFDTWWMNVFPREKPFLYSAGGYCTLSFIPTLGTMLLGLIAGKWLQSPVLSSVKLVCLFALGAILMLVAWLLDHQGLCPIVKRIWTPSWTLWSGGLCFFWLGALHAICDVGQWYRWGTFWKVIGANSIVAYVMSWTLEEPIKAAVERHFGWLLDIAASDSAQPFLLGAIVMVIFWIILKWLDRQKIYVRI